MLNYLPHLNPRYKKTAESKPAYIADKGDDDPVICLMANFIDSGCSNELIFIYSGKVPNSVGIFPT